MFELRPTVLLGILLAGTLTATAQLDPTKRELIQVGYNQPLQGRAPLAGYAFYYVNLPNFYTTNYTLRLALAPIYVDSELGFKHLLGPQTDFAVGLAGGGFADSYSEIRQGRYRREESFTGHGGSASSSIYHLFNPGAKIPLNGVLRGEVHYSSYDRDSDTADNFELPDNQPVFLVRGGLRWGGREPLLLPELAMELSAWYEGQFRTHPGFYGFNGDRKLEPNSHLFWGRALLVYTMPKLKHSFHLNLTAGTSLEPDRFSAYRLGGLLPLAAEFPLALPGYYHQEISAQRFVLLGGNYLIPLDAENRWTVNVQLTTAGVNYIKGLTQPGRWHSGVGGGLIYRSPSDAWQVLVGYAYGIDAIRNDQRGAHSVGFQLQFDLTRAKMPIFDPGEHPNRSRFLDRLFFKP